MKAERRGIKKPIAITNVFRQSESAAAIKRLLKKKWIEDIVIDQILKCIWNDNLIDDVTDLVMKMQRQENTAVSLLNKRLDEINKSISNILSAIEQGIITASTKQRLEELEGQKKEFEIEIAKENITRPTLDRDQIKFWFHRFRKADASKPENRRRLVDSFVNSIILYDDRIEFYFNFKKGAKTLSLTDLEKGSDMLDSLPPKILIRKNGDFYFLPPTSSLLPQNKIDNEIFGK